jgi:hypothetical protein
MRSSRQKTDERVDLAEDLLCAGLGPGHVERQLVKDLRVSTRQARRYIQRVYARWTAQSAADGPHRREKVIRMAERFYAKAMGAKDLRAAVQALHILSKMSGGFQQHNVEREERMAALGPPPRDPTNALLYAQRVMIDALHEVATNGSLDPERRLRWVAELGSKIGLTHAKALVEAKLEAIEEQAGFVDAKHGE